MKPTLKVLKIGGNVIENQEILSHFLADFAKLEGPKILVHGGGKAASKLSEKMGIVPNLVNGRRITDAETLEIIVMTYAGKINKKVVSLLQKNGVNSIGLSGADAGIIKAAKRQVRKIDYGYVGDIKKVNADILRQFIDNSLIPVICPISMSEEGQLLNTNADTIASEVAAAMQQYYDTELIYIFEKKGVLASIDDENSVIEHINGDSYFELLEKGVIADGMLPKLKNSFDALKKNVSKVLIGNTSLVTAKKDIHTTITYNNEK